MREVREDPSSTMPEPVMPLDYRPPSLPQRGSTREMVLGIIISLLMGLGAGAISFMLMIMCGGNDNISTIGAIGISAVVMALCLMYLMVWLRRVR